MPMRIKRVYDPPEPEDGKRVLVDRLWPRGLSKQAAALDAWFKHLAPSDALRHDFGHDPAKWPEFRERYREELAGLAEEGRREVDELAALIRAGTVTLCFAAHDPQRNNAVVLGEYLKERA